MHKNVPKNGCNSVIWVHKNSSVKVLSELSYMSQSCIWNWRMWRGGSYNPASWMWRSGGEVMTRLRQKKNVKSRLASILWWKRSGSCYWAWGWDSVCDILTFLILIMQGLLFFCCFISVSSSRYLIFLLQTVRLHKHNIKLQITRVRALKVWCQCCTTEIPVCCLVRLDQYSELIRTLG